MTKSIILLSGGLDSLVSLGLAKEQYNIELALTFDYGQKSAKNEIETSKKISEFYNIEHKVITLDWLKDITKTSLVSEKEIPTGKELENSTTSAQKVWVPNRNGLFLNIAGAFADAENFDYIIIGANKEEGETFPDNTQDFINKVNEEFKYSTLKQPEVIAPLINCYKNDIVKEAIMKNLPLEFVRSCYKESETNCGECESCTRLKSALIANNEEKYLKLLFK